MTNLSAPAASTDQAEAILQVFQTAAHPLTVPQAEKLYQGPKLKKKQLAQIVESQLLMQGQLFKCSPAGKSPRYWAHDEEQMVRERIEEVLAVNESMTEKSLADTVSKALPKISSKVAIDGYIQVMRQEGLLHEWPNESKNTRKSKNPKPNPKILSLQKYDPITAITFSAATLKALASALAKVELLGGSMEQFLQLLRKRLLPLKSEAFPQPETRNGERNYEPPHHETKSPFPPNKPESALPPSEIEDLILKGMRDLDSAADQGASVLLRDLRRHMPAEYRRHETFDAAVIGLAEQERIVLHRHDQPSCLTDAERDELVRDEAGTFYISLAKRV